MTTFTSSDIQTILSNIEQNESKASILFSNWELGGDPFDEPSWTTELCFLQLMTASEALNLSEFRRLIEVEYLRVKNSDNGFSASTAGPDGEAYSPVLATVRLFLKTLRALLPSDERKIVRKDVDQIIRDIHYVITDTKVFGTVPQNEMDVHLRIEAVLKCVFPDLKTKPTLTKQIKNFEPDTGILSIETLLEYKFLSRLEDAPRIADEILADTRGYTSKDWSSFLYVIYETKRFRTEHNWNQLLREAGVQPNTKVIVLSGEPEPTPPKSATAKPRGSKSKRGTRKSSTVKNTSSYLEVTRGLVFPVSLNLLFRIQMYSLPNSRNKTYEAEIRFAP
jgi:hypothetical protein